MRMILMAINVGLLLIVGAWTESAQAGDATFKLTNNTSVNLMVKFFSRNRDHEWPGHTRHYDLNASAQQSYNLACNDGEKICYGGSNTQDDKTYWGVGFKGNKGCQNCCLTCGGNVKHAWNLNGGPSNSAGGFGNDSVGVPADE